MFIQMLLAAWTLFYMVVGCCLFTQWLNIMQKDNRIRSGFLLKLFIVIVSILWVFVVPFAYLELLIKSKSPKESMDMLPDPLTEGLASES